MIERPFKYEVESKFVESFDPIIGENTVQIVPDTKITGDLKLEYDEETDTLFVWSNKKQKDLPEALGVAI